ncbi:MAG: hypothetical protein NTZ38_03395 [Candidatus Taylorbacteria bacterium]|nr:hypothetical protein [Candidatus Taylorbacteria bacterium]
MSKFSRLGIISGAVIFPSLAFAANMTLKDLMAKAADYLNQALLLLMGLAVLMFVWYVIQFFIKPSDKDRTEGSKYIMYSVIGFFVILSFWGIVNILQNTFGLNYGRPNTWNEIFPTNTGGSYNSF